MAHSMATEKAVGDNNSRLRMRLFKKDPEISTYVCGLKNERSTMEDERPSSASHSRYQFLPWGKPLAIVLKHHYV